MREPSRSARQSSYRVLALLMTAAALSACSLAPEHVRPALPVPVEYPTEYAPGGAEGEHALVLGWRDFFVDERLKTLIAAALSSNRDFAAAIAQVEQARGAYRVRRADRLPTLGLGADRSLSRSDAASYGEGGVTPGGTRVDRYAIDVGFSAFELDFWGRVRNLTVAARAEFLATFENARAFQLTLIREVASGYLATLEAKEQIALAEATVQSRRDELALARRRLTAGVTSALEFQQAETLLTQAETRLAALRLTKARGDNALRVLIGGPVPPSAPEAPPLGMQIAAAAIAPGLPSELLEARPDVLAAEERLRAARANIGAARAAYFPSIRLTGTRGYASTELGDLVGEDGNSWTLGASLSLPIFDFGRRRGNVVAARARERIALANYEGAIQAAFQDVADALAGRRYLAEQTAAQQRATAALRRLSELARSRYREGVVSYLEVLDAERNLFAAEQTLLSDRRAEIENSVSLYVALGGGLVEAR